ncbi:protein SPMIP9 isoform X2 [Phascolarctos cinereus]|nr:testis-expressed sequence 37 protein isoform X2 [Phascolarctos cinereus]XP_020834734.1 testis-expressed sequence 37 protein isoform X2 [Phascolarctos cinereus]
MEGMLYPSQAPLVLSMYKSSYMADYKDFSNYTPHLENPEEQRKIEAQLRQKEFCPPVAPSTSMLMKGYPAFRDPQMTAKDLGPCAFCQELAQKVPQAQPRICPSDYYPSLDPKKIPEYKTRYQFKRFLKPLELNYLLPEIGGHRELTDTQFPSDMKPIPLRWGPLKPFYL